MKRLKSVDVVIVGAGWTGLLLAKEIATRTGLHVVALERGPERTAVDYRDDMDELDYSIRLRMMQEVAEETVTFRHTPRDRALPVRQHSSFYPGTGVGGSGEHWSAQSYRFVPDVFPVLTQTKAKYGESRLPQDHMIRDWPFNYDDLEPYYDRAEKMMGVSGKAGNLQGRLIAGGNVFEGPRREEYPTPPTKLPYIAAKFRDAATSLGYHPYPIPAATLSVPYRNPDGVSRNACAFCGYCERFGCMIGAKAQPTNTLLPVLRDKKNFELRPSSWVRRIVVKDGKATGVEYTNQKGEEFFQPADLVLLSTFTMNNVRLLLLSKIGTPYDPRVGRIALGSNLTHQVNHAPATMFFDEPLNRFMGAGAAGVTISDFDGDIFDHAGLPFLRGGLLRVQSTGLRPIASFGVLPASVKPTWGSEWKKASTYYFDRTAAFSFSGEHLAYRENFMDLDPTYKDKFGDPLLRFTMDWQENERKMADFFTPKAVEIARAMGAKEIVPFAGLRRYDTRRYQTTHIQGGTVAGNSPDDSVLNTYSQHWQVPNLFVLGASAFPHNPGPNPTPTVLAMAYRTADALIERYLKHPGPLA